MTGLKIKTHQLYFAIAVIVVQFLLAGPSALAARRSSRICESVFTDASALPVIDINGPEFDVSSILDEAAVEIYWAPVRQKRTRERFAELSVFIRTHANDRVLPSESSTDPAERSLAIWFRNYRRIVGDDWHHPLPVDLQQFLEKRNLLVDPYRTAKSRWVAILDALILLPDFKALPSRTAKNPVIAKLGKWLDNQRQRKKNTWFEVLSEESIEKLIALDLLGALRKSKEERIAELLVAIAEPNFSRLPVEWSKVETEADLGVWLRGYMRRLGPSWYLTLPEWASQRLLQLKLVEPVASGNEAGQIPN